MADLPEVHSSAAGLKALCCCMAADGIEDLRRACGGHGYMMASGIAPLEADFKGPNTTAEGDYVVLSLQTARFLLKSVDAARAKEALPGTMFVLFMMVLPVVYIPVPIVIYTCMLGPLGVVGSIRDCVLVCFGVFFCLKTRTTLLNTDTLVFRCY
jgi:hypothetical protein